MLEAVIRERQHVFSQFAFAGEEAHSCKEFIVNKRDCPLLDLSDRAERSSTIPVLSQYVGEDHGDYPFPPVADYARACAGNYLEPDSVPSDDIDVPAWHKRKSAAVFRGAATGRGVCQDVNMRLRLCALSKRWAMGKLHSPALLDARLTSWNARHKWSAEGTLDIIDPSSAALPLTPRSGASSRNRLTMRQQEQWKYYVLVDGNMGASRLGELAQRCFVVLWVRTTLPQVSHTRAPLIAWEHFVPLATDLSDLEQMLLWCRHNDDHAQQIAENMRDALSPLLHRTALEASLARTLRYLPPPSSEESLRSIMRWLWDRRRSGIYVLLGSHGKVLMFRPFANQDFRNDWDVLRDTSKIRVFLKRARALWPNDRARIIQDSQRWWSNGCLVCNVMPSGVWGESMMPEIYQLVMEAGKLLAITT